MGVVWCVSGVVVWCVSGVGYEVCSEGSNFCVVDFFFFLPSRERSR